MTLLRRCERGRVRRALPACDFVISNPNPAWHGVVLRSKSALDASQRGQAIVLIALMLTVLVGMVALAVDGGRAYAVRRDLQAATDAAALAAGDNYVRSQNYVSAEQAAATLFGINLRLYAALPPPCAYASPGASPANFTCTYSDGTTLTMLVTDMGPGGANFTLTSKRNINLAFARVLTNGGSVSASAGASASAGNILYTPAIAALNQAGCGNTGVFVNGGSPKIIGNVVSNGPVDGSGGSLTVAGDIYQRCPATPPASTTLACYPSGLATPCTYPDVAGQFKYGYQYADPGFPLPTVVGAGQPDPSTTINVVLKPGTYAVDPSFGSGPFSPTCWFLAGGVYQWLSGYTNNGDLVSNELKPPAEAKTTNNTQKSTQFWDETATLGINCSGDFALTAVAGPNPIPNGRYAVEVTSVRKEILSGTSYYRESAPSRCLTVNLTPTKRNIKVLISNVPGATSYNVYVGALGSTCAALPGILGFAKNVVIPPLSVLVQNNAIGGCPSFTVGACSLGTESFTIDALSITAPNAGAAADAPGAYPPDIETSRLAAGLPNQSPDRAPPPAGDRADENQCDSVVGVRVNCPGTITPGAVEFYIPNNGCISNSGGDTYVFSGYQYNWVTVYEPGAPNAPCNNFVDGATNSAFVGNFYAPSAFVEFGSQLGFESESTGGVVADTIQFDNTMTVQVSPSFGPTPPATKLIS